MACLWKHGWAIAMAIGLVLGLAIGGLWPDTPLHAVATDRSENYAMATGFVGDGIEAIYFLDFLTGTLRAAVLSNQSRGFQAVYEANVNADLATVVERGNANLEQTNAARRRAKLPPLPAVQMPQSPKYLMVTGAIDMRRGAAARHIPPQAALYVAETNTGIVLTYLIPWNQNAHSADIPESGPLALWAGGQFAASLVQTQ